MLNDAMAPYREAVLTGKADDDTMKIVLYGSPFCCRGNKSFRHEAFIGRALNRGFDMLTCRAMLNSFRFCCEAGGVIHVMSSLR